MFLSIYLNFLIFYITCILQNKIPLQIIKIRIKIKIVYKKNNSKIIKNI